MQDRARAGRLGLFAWLGLLFSKFAEYVLLPLSSGLSLVDVLILMMALVLIVGVAYSILSERIDRKLLLLINLSSHTFSQLYFYSICTPHLLSSLNPYQANRICTLHATSTTPSTFASYGLQVSST